MERSVRAACALAVSSTALAAMTSIACDLHLNPYVDQSDASIYLPPSNPTTTIDSGSLVVDTGAPTPNLDAGPDVAGRKRVFLSSTLTTGAMEGTRGADAKCQELAKSAKLGGTFVAWLSVTNSPALARLTGQGPWYLVDQRTRVFANRDSITTTFPEVPIDRDENGNRSVQGQSQAWTGTLAAGTAAPSTDNCANFALDIGNGLAGRTDQKDSKWTQAGLTSCNLPIHLYCIEQ